MWREGWEGIWGEGKITALSLRKEFSCLGTSVGWEKKGRDEEVRLVALLVSLREAPREPWEELEVLTLVRKVEGVSCC